MGTWEQQFDRVAIQNLTKSINGLSEQLKAVTNMSAGMDRNPEVHQPTHRVPNRPPIERPESAMENLRSEIRAFGQQAIALCDAISAADAEELVAAGYPFDSSFDEIMIKIIEWSGAVVRESYKQENKS